MAYFGRAIEGLLNREGGFVHDPSDSGGATKYGISQRAYPALDIAALSRIDAEDIYYTDYWIPSGCEGISSQQLAAVVFDFAVNAGVKRSAKTLQKSLGVAVDGEVGPVTLAAANFDDGEKIALRFTVLRIGYYARLAQRRKGQMKFLAGWITRAIKALHT